MSTRKYATTEDISELEERILRSFRDCLGVSHRTLLDAVRETKTQLAEVMDRNMRALEGAMERGRGGLESIDSRLASIEARLGHLAAETRKVSLQTDPHRRIGALSRINLFIASRWK